ncbi:ATP-grasp domain-containing protein [Nonomuraea sp. NPDC005650]|uniref:ATP-grasp domain-containing protein n=1 Tax=Nonomuraea sp. NPDC005650 TaxID=3157045 RepID=UPI0033BD8E77
MTAQLLEHEGKSLIRQAGIPVPDGAPAASAAEAGRLAAGLGPRVAVKAQVPTGGRGKAGAIRLVDRGRAAETAAELLGSVVKGHEVREVLVEEALDVEAELFVAVTVDARARTPVLLVGGAGGVEVEAEPRLVGRVAYPLRRGLRAADVWRAAERARLSPEQTAGLLSVARAVDRVFREQRAHLVEINPLVRPRGSGRLVAADVRVIPDAALDGRPRADPVQEASRALGFDFVLLDPAGDVGLLTTGAGASMMLVDLLGAAGLAPVNFCDLRTGSLRGDHGRLAFVLDRLRETSARVIVVNVFAGITDLDEVATLLVRALRERPVDLPVVVRLEGRGAAAARRALEGHGLRTATSPEELVEIAVALGGRR